MKNLKSGRAKAVVYTILAAVFLVWIFGGILRAQPAEKSRFISVSSYKNVYKYYDHFQQAAKKYGVPKLLLIVLANVESRVSPYAVNFGGEARFYDSESKALQGISNYEGSNFDVGLMQINSFWLREFDVEPEKIIRPKYNIMFGAWVIKDCFDRYGINWKAIAAYHTNPSEKENYDRSANYAKRVMRHYKSLKNVF